MIQLWNFIEDVMMGGLIQQSLALFYWFIKYENISQIKRGKIKEKGTLKHAYKTMPIKLSLC